MFEMERRRAEIERHRENSARLASAYAKFETTGQGSLEFEERVDFGLTFVEEPYVSYGMQLDLDALAEQLELEPGEQPPIPMVSGAVTAWDQDNRDFYVGCWVAVRVRFGWEDGVPADMEVLLNHHFTFTAIAMKDIPLDVRD